MSIQNDTIRSLKAIKEKHLFTVSKSIEDSVRDPNLKRSLQFIKEKGSGCWLTALPLKRFGYSLNKIEFRDALYLRYGWEIPNTPFHCACGERNNVNNNNNNSILLHNLKNYGPLLWAEYVSLLKCPDLKII